MSVRDSVALVASAILIAAVTIAAFAPLLASEQDGLIVERNPDATALTHRLHAPSIEHLLGTDELGRDVLARLIHGSRVSLLVGFGSASIAFLIGVFLGLIGGWRGGWTDSLLMRLIEVAVSFPFYFLALALLAVFSQSFATLLIALSITSWTTEARLVRGEAIRLRSHPMIEAARSSGAGEFRVLFAHVLPNAVTPALSTFAFGVAAAILAESALSFLGFGVPLPQASWGSMLASADDHLQQAWWIALYPGLAIVLVVGAIQVIGERLRRRVSVDVAAVRMR